MIRESFDTTHVYVNVLPTMIAWIYYRVNCFECLRFYAPLRGVFHAYQGIDMTASTWRYYVFVLKVTRVQMFFQFIHLFDVWFVLCERKCDVRDSCPFYGVERIGTPVNMSKEWLLLLSSSQGQTSRSFQGQRHPCSRPEMTWSTQNLHLVSATNMEMNIVTNDNTQKCRKRRWQL